MKLLPVGFAVLFAVAHTQSPLYYSNQNQYFLHGAARAGVGDLRSDWLANTADPTPVFSALVAFSLKHLGEWPFHVVFFVALMAYFLSAWWLVKPSARSGPVFAALFTLLHAGIARWASDRLLGADFPWFFHCGLASQYILGAGWQPSVVGVALLASVAAYRNDRTETAVALASLSICVHATYLLPVLLLVVGYAIEQKVRGSLWNVAKLSLIALVAALGPIAYILLRFGPDGEQFGSAQRILAEVRIPHHTRPARWFDWVAGLQVVWMLAGLVALRRNRLLVPLCVTAGLAVAGTLAVILTENPTFSLMFPWRISAALVPVSTAVLSARIAAKVCEPRRSHAPGDDSVIVVAGSMRPALRNTIPVALLVLLAMGGLVVSAFHLGYREPEGEEAALQFIAEHRQPGELYLVPARFPKPTTARGVYSNTFAQPPDPSAVVYFEMARFRLRTGAALYVDFKAIPYKDTEVMEWHRRVAQCEVWFRDANWDERGVIEELGKEGITHVVAPTKLSLKSARLTEVFTGGAYTVYRVR